MPKAATVPLPQMQVPTSPRSARQEAWRAQPIEARVSALEARWEETTPTLATRKDLSDLRTELVGSMGSLENRLIRWILGAAFGLLFAVLGIFFSGYISLIGRIDSAVTELCVETRALVGDLKEETGASISELRTENRAAITELKEELRATNARIDARFERMEARFERIDAKFERIDAKFDALMAELRAQRNDTR